MAKRAIERLDAEIGDGTAVILSRERVAAILTALEMLAEKGTLPPELAGLRETLVAGQGPNALPESTQML
jgi:hypothetical protein